MCVLLACAGFFATSISLLDLAAGNTLFVGILQGYKFILQEGRSDGLAQLFPQMILVSFDSFWSHFGLILVSSWSDLVWFCMMLQCKFGKLDANGHLQMTASICVLPKNPYFEVFTIAFFLWMAFMTIVTLLILLAYIGYFGFDNLKRWTLRKVFDSLFLTHLLFSKANLPNSL